MKFRNVDKRRLVIVVAAVIMMGFALSFLNRTNLGTDPCTMFNLGMSRILGLSLGTWQAIFNSFLFVIFLIKCCTETVCVKICPKFYFVHDKKLDMSFHCP